VYLFDTFRLLDTLAGRGIKIGIATSIRRTDLEAARIFPDAGVHPPLHVTPEQTALLSLFA
jgi:hypothetical protein